MMCKLLLVPLNVGRKSYISSSRNLLKNREYVCTARPISTATQRGYYVCSYGGLTFSCEDVPAEVPESHVVHSGLNGERRLRAVQDANSPNITNDSEPPGKGTDPAGEESESEQRMIVSPVDHSTDPSGGKGCLGASVDR